ncbi:hypothetical protein DFH08DRAFT_1019155 [Mycena albidolilacea]|uniref:Uncharacterized protein n=1 Tax=Mycena albidolilacea TaxID=1033008 RepID=A0AAD6ZQP8_9AGAR|nr:hypothetical protein DFH08DRAFT_1019155 [Mycena albidolilacea]
MEAETIASRPLSLALILDLAGKLESIVTSLQLHPYPWISDRKPFHALTHTLVLSTLRIVASCTMFALSSRVRRVSFIVVVAVLLGILILKAVWPIAVTFGSKTYNEFRDDLYEQAFAQAGAVDGALENLRQIWSAAAIVLRHPQQQTSRIIIEVVFASEEFEEFVDDVPTSPTRKYPECFFIDFEEPTFHAFHNAFPVAVVALEGTLPIIAMPQPLGTLFSAASGILLFKWALARSLTSTSLVQATCAPVCTIEDVASELDETLVEEKEQTVIQVGAAPAKVEMSSKVVREPTRPRSESESTHTPSVQIADATPQPSVAVSSKPTNAALAQVAEEAPIHLPVESPSPPFVFASLNPAPSSPLSFALGQIQPMHKDIIYETPKTSSVNPLAVASAHRTAVSGHIIYQTPLTQAPRKTPFGCNTASTRGSFVYTSSTPCNRPEILYSTFGFVPAASHYAPRVPPRSSGIGFHGRSNRPPSGVWSQIPHYA